MKFNRNICAIMAVAGLGYAAGQFDLLPGGTSIAAPGEAQEEGKVYDAAPEMLAMMEAGTPGKHHEYLQSLIGEFDAEWKISMGPGTEWFVSTGTVTREWVLEGRDVKEIVEADSDMGHFSGIGYIGYSNIDGQYEVVWMDSMSTTIMRETGILDPDTMVMNTRSTMRDPFSGKVLSSRGVLNLSSSGRQVYTGYITGADGKERKHMEGVTERR